MYDAPRNACSFSPVLRIKLKTVGKERIFQLQTEPWWRGYLLLTIAPDNLDRSIVAAVQIVDSDELDALENELRVATREKADPERNLPTASVEAFRIPTILREAAQYAEGASQLLGPRIRINVRPHQHSLAVMGGFDPRATPRVLGNPQALVRDIVAVVAIIRKRLSDPAPFRIAHQLLAESRDSARNRQLPPVLFVEFSVPAEEEDEGGFALITDGLVQEINDGLGGSDAWDFNVKYVRNRILVVGRVGPFKWPRRRRSQPPMLPI